MLCGHLRWTPKFWYLFFFVWQENLGENLKKDEWNLHESHLYSKQQQLSWVKKLLLRFGSQLDPILFCTSAKLDWLLLGPREDKPPQLWDSQFRQKWNGKITWKEKQVQDSKEKTGKVWDMSCIVNDMCCITLCIWFRRLVQKFGIQTANTPPAAW